MFVYLFIHLMAESSWGAIYVVVALLCMSLNVGCCVCEPKIKRKLDEVFLTFQVISICFNGDYFCERYLAIIW